MRPLFCEESLEGAGVHNFTAVFSCSRSDVNNPVGCVNRVFVVFNNNERVADIAQSFECFDETSIITLVESNRRLVKDVQNTGQSGTNLGGKPDSLRLAARQRPRGARHGQISETNVQKEFKTGDNLPENGSGNQRVSVGEAQTRHERVCVFKRQFGRVRD